MQPPKFLPRWKCGASGCLCDEEWQPVPDAARNDLAATQRVYDAHHTAAHPEPEVEEVVSVERALAA